MLRKAATNGASDDSLAQPEEFPEPLFPDGRPIRHLVGKTSWQHSLDTTDQALADARRASYAARYKLEIIRLRSIAVAEIEKRAAKVVDEKFADLAKFHGSMDRAVAAELASLAWTVRGSWSLGDAVEVEREIFGEAISDAWEYGTARSARATHGNKAGSS